MLILLAVLSNPFDTKGYLIALFVLWESEAA